MQLAIIPAMKLTFDPPRWPNGPRICPAANLPAFDSDADAAAFRASNCPGHTVVAQWTCNVCGKIHFWGVGGDPSGASSGTTRIAKHLPQIKERFLNSPAAKTMK